MVANYSGETIVCRDIKTGFQAGTGGSGVGSSTSAALSVTGSLTITQAKHLGVPLYLNATGGGTITLPAATGTNNSYVFYVTTSLTSSSTWILNPAGSDTMGGLALIAATASGSFVATSGTTVHLTLSATTKGGLIGGVITFTDTASGAWTVQASLVGSGTAVTPFS